VGSEMCIRDRVKLLAKTAKKAQAQRELQEVESRAAAKGLFALGWQARLAIADIQSSSDLAGARSNLQLVERQATLKGFHLLGRKAADAEASLRDRN